MDQPNPSPAVEALLAQSRGGDRAAAGQLFEVLYGELRRRAQAILHGSTEVTLQPTVLVHEAWLRLVPRRGAAFQDRMHFLRVAAQAMRSVLVDHARARGADKRGGDRDRLPFDVLLSIYEDRAVDLLALDEGLRELERLDEQLSRVVEMRFFGGYEIAAIGEVLGVSASTVDRAWRTARSWLRARLEEREE
jgi:RNA polymerase sigma factor (TIGR02999 family)